MKLIYGLLLLSVASLANDTKIQTPPGLFLCVNLISERLGQGLPLPKVDSKTGKKFETATQAHFKLDALFQGFLKKMSKQNDDAKKAEAWNAYAGDLMAELKKEAPFVYAECESWQKDTEPCLKLKVDAKMGECVSSKSKPHIEKVNQALERALKKRSQEK